MYDKVSLKENNVKNNSSKEARSSDINSHDEMNDDGALSFTSMTDGDNESEEEIFSCLTHVGWL